MTIWIQTTLKTGQMQYTPVEEFYLIWLTPRDQPISVNGKAIKVGAEQYINRLIQFVSSKVESKTYADVVGADLSSIGIRLDAINNAVCKGTHVDVSKDEASRYIIHTYLLISDIISLYNVAEDMVS